MSRFEPHRPAPATESLEYWLAQAPESSRSLTGLRIVVRNMALRRTIVCMLSPISLGLILGGIVFAATNADPAPGAILMFFGALIGVGLLIGLGHWHRYPVPSHMKMTLPGRAPKTLPGAWTILGILTAVCWLALTRQIWLGTEQMTWQAVSESAEYWLVGGLAPLVLLPPFLFPQPLCLARANSHLRRRIDNDPRIRAELAERARNPGASRSSFGQL